MSKKVKKIFKKLPVIPFKITFNNKLTNWRQREQGIKESILKNSISGVVFNSLLKDQELLEGSQNIQIMLFSKIFGVDKFSHKSKSKNLCYYVGRGRSFNRKLYMARHTIRKFARFGMLPGFIKERC